MSDPIAVPPPSQEAVKTTVAQSDDGQVVSTTVAKTNADDPVVPNWLRSPTAMWFGTLLTPIHLALAIANVGKAYDIWKDNWWATVVASGLIIGAKKGPDLISTMILKGKGG